MAIRIDKTQAEALVRDAAAEASLRMRGDGAPIPANQGVPSVLPVDKREQVYSAWAERIQKLSELCAAGGAKTHIAFVGTALIAKAVCSEVDLKAIKPKHAAGNRNAFSARSLCHGVLVPLAVELGIDIGATGREPLNNQPYFRMTRLGDGTPVHERSRPAFEFTLSMIDDLQQLTTTDEARVALVAFVAVRREHRPEFADWKRRYEIDSEGLARAIHALVRDDSEHGRRAQAVVAGLMDAFAGSSRVESGRINDPSRRHPGDVCVRAVGSSRLWEKAFEVRDKPVSLADIRIFARTCSKSRVVEAAVVAVAEQQVVIGDAILADLSRDLGIEITVFTDWRDFVHQVLFWASDSATVTASLATQFIRERLIAVEANAAAVSLWVELTDGPLSQGDLS